MVCRQFYDLHHMQSYLNDSIIMLNHRPILVRACTGRAGEYMVTYTELEGKYEDNPVLKMAAYGCDTMDTRPIPLGMVNAAGNVFHMMRVPVRQWKVGLSSRSIATDQVFPHMDLTREAGRELRALPYSQVVVACVKGDYPTIDQIQADMGGVGAFSRRFAINGEDLYYRTRGVVGKLYGNTPTVFDKHFFLREVLEEDCHAREKAHHQAA
jgi:hypothetical protein